MKVLRGLQVLREVREETLGVCDDGVVYEPCGGDVLRCRGAGALSGAGHGHWCSGTSGRYCVWDCPAGALVKLRYCVWNSCLGVLHRRYHHV